ncbi:MAG: DUF2971 domain-containing protein [Terriglobales bacterium]|jgi:DUF2971 family protein
MSTTVITENIFGSDKPDRPLYHYTTQEGLLGIVKKREMWATHHQYLNDTQEFLHAKALFCTEIERRLNSESAGSEICLVLEEMRSAVNRSNENTSWYVASFSEDGDSLPQWRAYGGPTSGFALGIWCDQLVLPSGFRMKRCIYDLKRQRDFAEASITWQLKSALAERTELGRVEAGMGLSMILGLLALTFKNEKFKEEKEWRIIGFPPNRINPVLADPPQEKIQLEFREGRSMLVPYLPVPLKNDKGEFPLDRVVVGPNPNPEQSLRSVKILLESQGLFAAMKSISSDIPYRNW